MKPRRKTTGYDIHGKGIKRDNEKNLRPYRSGKGSRTRLELESRKIKSAIGTPGMFSSHETIKSRGRDSKDN
jgi:hypothetical protein